MTEHHFFGHSYWGSSLLLCILSWLSAFVWPLDDPASAPEHTRVGVSWMELVLSFMLCAKGYIPLHRPAATPCHTFAWARTKSEAAAFNYTWNECATQFAGMVSQVISLCCQPVIPAHVRRARICSLYRQGAGTCVFGWSHRPEFPHQAQVAEILKVEFHQRVRPCSYDWMPAIDPCSQDSPCAFTWQHPHETWNVLQKRLKKGTSLARLACP